MKSGISILNKIAISIIFLITAGFILLYTNSKSYITLDDNISKYLSDIGIVDVKIKQNEEYMNVKYKNKQSGYERGN